MIQQKVAVITGATGGIGRAIAMRFACDGFNLVLADTGEADLQILSADLSKEHRSGCMTVAGDLSDLSYARTIIEKAVNRWGRIDVLINNAAWRKIETMRHTVAEDWNKTISVCLTAPAFLSKWAAESMENCNTGGVIINVSSIMADRPAGYCPAYVAAKGALDSLTRELAVTYGRHSIRVVGVSPGIINTRMGEDYTDKDGKNVGSQIAAELLDFIPLCRYGTAEDVARFVAWVSSSEATYISGTTLVVDGGFTSNFNTYSIKSLQFPNEF